jgi:hypothetical protein
MDDNTPSSERNGGGAALLTLPFAQLASALAFFPVVAWFTTPAEPSEVYSPDHLFGALLIGGILAGPLAVAHAVLALQNARRTPSHRRITALGLLAGSVLMLISSPLMLPGLESIQLALNAALESKELYLTNALVSSLWNSHIWWMLPLYMFAIATFVVDAMLISVLVILDPGVWSRVALVGLLTSPTAIAGHFLARWLTPNDLDA